MAGHVLESHQNGRWMDCLTLNVNEQEHFDASYVASYVLDHLDQLDSLGYYSASVNLPLGWDGIRQQGMPAFLLDLIPAGAARRTLKTLFPAIKLNPDNLLEHAIAPIGHLRRSPGQPNPRQCFAGFSRQLVQMHGPKLAAYLQSAGADPIGALGAGGEAPKFLLSENASGLLSPDASLPDEQAVKHWLVKFARNRGSDRDQAVLRAEYLYYKALAQLGFDCVATNDMTLVDGEYPALWLRRFDRHVVNGVVERSAVESIYSVMGCNQPGSYLGHFEVLARLVALWKACGQGHQVAELIVEYLVRDIIKRLLGDPDNHGRNQSVIRDHSGIRLAPMYDLAPMVVDDEGITRLTKWPNALEHGLAPWQEICAICEQHFDQTDLLERLKQRITPLLNLADALSDLGLDSIVMNHPGVPLGNASNLFKRWSLL